MLKKRIGILEIGSINHYTYLFTLIRICSSAGFDITIFCSIELKKTLIKSGYFDNDLFIISKKEHEKNYLFLKRIKIYANEKLDLFWINTYQFSIKYTLFYFFVFPNVFSIITIHDVKTWLSNSINIIEIIKKPTSVVFFLSRKIIFSKFNALAVLEPQFKIWIEEKTRIKKRVYVLPFSLCEFCSIEQSKIQFNKINIVIPGTITNSRRDYISLVSAIENYSFNSLNFFFAGKVVDSTGLEIFSKLKLTSLINKIYLYDDFISESTFKEILINSHFILVNINRFFKTDGFQEEYGLTKSTGGIWNCIRFSKPGLIPNWMSTPQINESSLIRYDATNLLDILIKIDKMSLNEYNNLLIKARHNSSKYYKSNEDFKKVIQDLKQKDSNI